MKSDKNKVLLRLILLLLICELFSTPYSDSSSVLGRHKIVHAHQKSRIAFFAFINEKGELEDDNDEYNRHCSFVIIDLQVVAKYLNEIHSSFTALIPPIKRQGLHLPLFKLHQIFLI